MNDKYFFGLLDRMTAGAFCLSCAPELRWVPLCPFLALYEDNRFDRL